MPRAPRNASIVPGALTHAISRLVDGRFVFDDAARAEYLARLGHAITQTDWRLVSFALMSSHVHLGLIAGESPMSAWTHRLHTAVAQWINRRNRVDAPRTLGHVFAQRPSTSHLVHDAAQALLAYHHNNPVRAGVVEHPALSSWTSHRAYLALSRAPLGLDVALGLKLCGFAETRPGRDAFHRMVVSRTEGPDAYDYLVAVDPAQDDAHAFVAAPAVCERPRAADVARLAAAAVGVSRQIVRGGTRTADAVAARRVALAAWRRLGGTDAEMAEELEVSGSAASQLLRQEHRVVPLEGAIRDVLARVRET